MPRLGRPPPVRVLAAGCGEGGAGKELLRAEGFSAGRFRELSFSLKEGEIVGVVGDVHQQAQHGRGQTLLPDVARLVQHARLDGAYPPLGITARQSRPAASAAAACSCPGRRAV